MAEAPDPNPAVQAVEALTAALGNLQRQDAIKIPLFSGKAGESPSAHLLKLDDYCNTNNKDLHADHIFRDSLQGKARQWYEERDQNWDNAQLILEFKKEFDIYKGSQRALMKRWYNLQFDPSSIKITDFVREVKSLGDVVEINDAGKLAALKIMIPKESGWVISNAPNFRDACTLLRKHYEEEEQKLDKVESTGATAGSNPFNSMEGQMNSTERKSQDQIAILTDEVRKLSKDQSKLFENQSELHRNQSKLSDNQVEILASIREIRTPYKPHTSFRGRGRGRPNFGFQDRNFRSRRYDNPRQNFRGRSPFRDRDRARPRSRGREGFRSQSRDRKFSHQNVQDQRHVRFREDRRCFFCHELGHLAQECPHRQHRGRSQSRERHRQAGRREEQRFSRHRPDYRSEMNQLDDMIHQVSDQYERCFATDSMSVLDQDSISDSDSELDSGMNFDDLNI